MTRRSKLAAISAGAAALAGAAANAATYMLALGEALKPEGNGRSNQIGPGQRSILTLHRKIKADRNRATDGADRMDKVIAERQSNWGPFSRAHRQDPP